LDGEGNRKATWPAKFPLPVIDEMRQTYRGDMDTWMQEFMCEATSAAHRTFRKETIRVVPRGVKLDFEPAATTGSPG